MLSRAFQAFISCGLIAFTLGSQARHEAPKTFVNATQIIESQELESPYPYEFPVLQNGSLGDSGQFPMPLCHGFKLEEATIDQLQQALSNGVLTSVKLAICYINRIYQTDGYIRCVYNTQIASRF
jgi:amidase